MFNSVLVICVGASLGACLRWLISTCLNNITAISLGTLSVNLLGGYLIGIVASFLIYYPLLPSIWKLFLITGFLGSLTTFSSFSIEVVNLIEKGNLLLAVGTISLHLFGSILMTFMGIASFSILRKLF